jgi:hypothetical protein
MRITILKIIKWIAILLGTLFFLLIVFVMNIDFFWHELPFRGTDFNQPVWSSAFTNCKKHDAYCISECVRGGMYKDLEENYLLIGTSHNAVIQLLGKSEYTHPTQHSCINYHLGNCSGLKIDADFLSVCFGTQDKINKVYHWQS